MKQLQFVTITAFPLPGTEISEVKTEAQTISKGFKCQVTFNHNGTDYIADKEGNIAISNKPYSELGV